MSAKELRGYSIRATDGDAGRVQGLYFDDESWRIRYVVVRVGGLLFNRRVLIAPWFVERTDRDYRALSVGLTKEQVKSAPGVGWARPVADRREFVRLDGYGAQPYWGSGWEAAGAGPVHAKAFMPEQTAGGEIPWEEQGDRHLRSTKEVEGYRIEAVGIGTVDAGVGRVEDFVVDDEGWEIRSIVVDKRDWLPDSKLLVSPGRISAVSWTQKAVYVDLTQDEVISAPEWDPNEPPGRGYVTA